jgi:hypothetical protein
LRPCDRRERLFLKNWQSTPFTCVLSVVAVQLNLKQAQAVKFLTTVEEATGYDESLSTMYRLIQDSDSSLANILADKTTVATVFAPVDDVSLVSGRTQQLIGWRSCRSQNQGPLHASQ